MSPPPSISSAATSRLSPAPRIHSSSPLLLSDEHLATAGSPKKTNKKKAEFLNFFHFHFFFIRPQFSAGSPDFSESQSGPAAAPEVWLESGGGDERRRGGSAIAASEAGRRS